jgi:ribonuclease HI
MLAKALFCDGGVVNKNPSNLGGTWAYCYVEGGARVVEAHDYLLPWQMGTELITNNQMELIAMVFALEAMPLDWVGKIYCDSQNTLGRCFEHWRMQNIPAWLMLRMDAAVKRMEDRLTAGTITYELIAGHPTKADLARGYKDKGMVAYRVFPHNVWCDRMCRVAAEELAEKLRSGYPFVPTIPLPPEEVQHERRRSDDPPHAVFRGGRETR